MLILEIVIKQQTNRSVGLLISSVCFHDCRTDDDLTSWVVWEKDRFREVFDRDCPLVEFTD